MYVCVWLLGVHCVFTRRKRCSSDVCWSYEWKHSCHENWIILHSDHIRIVLRSDSCVWKHGLNTFCTVEQGPRSSQLCSRLLWNEAHVPWSLLFLSWKTQPNWNQFQNELPSDEGRELYHIMLHCFDIQIRENAMASQRNINFLKHWIYTFYGWLQRA